MIHTDPYEMPVPYETVTLQDAGCIIGKTSYDDLEKCLMSFEIIVRRIRIRGKAAVLILTPNELRDTALPMREARATDVRVSMLPMLLVHEAWLFWEEEDVRFCKVLKSFYNPSALGEVFKIC